MLKAFYKARRKKGFTLVEIIVVIAIIGVILAITIPSLLYDRRPEQGRAMAKDLLYNTQDILTSVCAAAPDAAAHGKMVWYDSGKTRIVVYVNIDRNGEVTGTGLVGISGDGLSLKSFSSLSAEISDTSDPLSLNSQFKRFCDITSSGLENSLTVNNNNMQGTLAAVTDEKFNVLAAYWFEAGISTAAGTSGNRLFTAKDVLGSGYLCSAYPAALSDSGELVFDV